MLFGENSSKIYMAPAVFGPAGCEMQGPDGAPFGGVLCRVEQYVTAYRVNADMLPQLLPEGYSSLRPVLRLNVELLRDVAWLAGRDYHRIEFNTPVEYKGRRGWFNLITWENDCDSIVCGRDIHGIPKLYADIAVTKTQQDQATKIKAKSGDFTFLDMCFTRTGKEGGCPKENDNEGNFYFRYIPRAGNGFTQSDARYTTFTSVETITEKKEYCDCSFQWHKPTFQDMPVGYKSLQQICAIENQEILGAYVVHFDRTKNLGDEIVL